MPLEIAVVGSVDYLMSRYGTLHPVVRCYLQRNPHEWFDAIVGSSPKRSVVRAIPFLSECDELVISHTDRSLSTSAEIVDVGFANRPDRNDRVAYCPLCKSELITYQNEWECTSARCPGRTKARISYFGSLLGIDMLTNPTAVDALISEKVVVRFSDLFATETWMSLQDWDGAQAICPPIRRDMVFICGSLYRMESPGDVSLAMTALASFSIPGLRPRDVPLLINYACKHTTEDRHPLETLAACFRSDDIFAEAVRGEFSSDSVVRHVYGLITPYADDIERFALNITGWV